MCVCPVSCCAKSLLAPLKCAWEGVAQIISCIAVTVFTKWTHAYEKRPGLTVVGGIVTAVILSAILVPEKPPKLSAVNVGAKFLREHFSEEVLEDPSQNATNFVLGKIFWYYCFGQYKKVDPPIFLSKETRSKITDWRTRKLDPKEYEKYLDNLSKNFGKDDYDDSGNELFTEVKAAYFNEHQAKTIFMNAWEIACRNK